MLAALRYLAPLRYAPPRGRSRRPNVSSRTPGPNRCRPYVRRSARFPGAAGPRARGDGFHQQHEVLARGVKQPAQLADALLLEGAEVPERGGSEDGRPGGGGERAALSLGEA